ncbi:glycoside hydrolase family 66 protein [Bacillus infantis]|uniref:glycoside hydrolase family 66 protein n=1 Tax=Bacillus infantis TaxID=324767 RepID=UPI001CD5E4BA|nr:glycoside hydrolase family 66 protein [Bacillus infantis]MCA1040671.1 glycoside hydrolase family 66 protein [Bacillus infantis]
MKGRAAILGLLLLAALASLYPLKEKEEKTAPNAPSLQESKDLLFNLQTDKARYNPGDSVQFSIEAEAEGTVKVTYYHLGRQLDTEAAELKAPGTHKWSWNPPEKDFKGYLAVVSVENGSSKQTETIAVDVSSSWSRFPRYGFLSDFADSSSETAANIISALNRYHLNGLQFYDWHYEHQEPLKMEDNLPAGHWVDVANRRISLQKVQQYIGEAKQRNIKAMAYNLLYGSFEQNGLPREWQLFKDQSRSEPDIHPLPGGWKSNLLIMNPANPWWQDHLIKQQKMVYEYLGFDGWHIDQLGDRGEVFNEHGDSIQLAESFQPFLEKIKQKLPDKEIVMNAVNQFGQPAISGAGAAFLYTEVWDPYKHYGDLKKILDENRDLSNNGQASVLAAYMNYHHSDERGMFNEAGVLLTDAVIFSNGGAHLELGEHMLSKEYFPHNQLQMSEGLQQKMASYYDFLTAYENVLRDHTRDSEAAITSHEGLPLATGEPEQQKIWVLPKESGNRKILHFINFLDAVHMEWRDTNADQAKPKERRDLTFSLEANRKVEKLWLASPDIKSGRPEELPFRQENGNVIFSLPSLTYWDMVVAEY